MQAALRSIGLATRDLISDAGAISRLAAEAARGLFGALRGERVPMWSTVQQSVRAGFDSLPLVALIAFLVGSIMALQSAYQLAQIGQIDLVPALVALSVTRELAPLLTSILVAGRYGSAIAAELGTMRVSQEIDALTVMGINPTCFLVVPRLVALLVALPCLTIFADLVGILGGQAIAQGVLDMGLSRYWLLTRDSLVLADITTGLFKALAFAAIIGLVGCHQGLKTRGGAEEVGRSTTAAVVRSIVLMMAADLFVTAIDYVKG